MKRHHWLLALPFVWQIAMVPLVNDVAWRPLGLPFPMVWQMLGIVFASIVIAIVHALDKRATSKALDKRATSKARDKRAGRPGHP